MRFSENTGWYQSRVIDMISFITYLFLISIDFTAYLFFVLIF